MLMAAMVSNTCTSVNSNVEFSTQVLLVNSNQSKSQSSNRNFPNQRFQNGEVSDYQYRPYRESADHDQVMRFLSSEYRYDYRSLTNDVHTLSWK
jgi:hypothetical protein